MPITKLLLAATVLVAPAAYAKNNNTASPVSTVVVTPPTPDGYHGKGSNPSDDKSSSYGGAKGSYVEPSHHCDNNNNNTTVYIPENQYQDDAYYYSTVGYAPATDAPTKTRVKNPRGDAEVGLRYAAGKGVEASPDLTGAGFYGRIFHPTGRYAAEISFDALASDPTSGVFMKQGSLLLSYDLFLNPDGIVRPYGSMGIGGTWHGVSGSQNVFGALAFGVGLDISLGKALSVNLDGRLIADSEADESDTPTSAAITANNLNAAQEFVVSSAGVSFRW